VIETKVTREEKMRSPSGTSVCIISRVALRVALNKSPVTNPYSTPSLSKGRD